MKEKNLSRRKFLTSTAIIGAAGMVAPALLSSCSGGNGSSKLTPLKQEGEYYVPELPDKAIDGRELKVGVIGCGGRGSGATINLLDAANGIKVTALGDVFADRLEDLRARLRNDKQQEVADEMCFTGFDAYQKVIDAGVDMVIIATPPAFRPVHFQYATEKGVHSFLEKPIAVDPKGYRTIMAAAKQAQAKGLSVVTGTQRHHERRYVEANKQIQAGLIGEITGGNVYWNQGMLWYKERQPGWSDMEWNIRDWVNWTWLSGDHIVEQHVHNIDVFMWMSGLKLATATSFGARHRRVTGDQFDMFSTDFVMENGVHMHSMCRQIDGCSNKVSEFIQGSKGSWDSETNEIKDLQGNVIWKYDEEAANQEFKQHDPYVLEHVDWVNHIRKGTAHEEASDCAASCMAAIMAREAAYTGATTTWDEMTQSPMDLMPAELKLGPLDLAAYTVKKPGQGQ